MGNGFLSQPLEPFYKKYMVSYHYWTPIATLFSKLTKTVQCTKTSEFILSFNYDINNTILRPEKL